VEIVAALVGNNAFDRRGSTNLHVSEYYLTVHGRYMDIWESGNYRRAVVSSFLSFLRLLACFSEARSLRPEAPPRIMLNRHRTYSGSYLDRVHPSVTPISYSSAGQGLYHLERRHPRCHREPDFFYRKLYFHIPIRRVQKLFECIDVDVIVQFGISLDPAPVLRASR